MEKLKLDQNNEVFKHYCVNILDGLSKINIFVGANNSGKSRFLRELFKLFTKAFVLSSEKDFKSMDLPLVISKEDLFEKDRGNIFPLNEDDELKNRFTKSKAKSWLEFVSDIESIYPPDDPFNNGSVVQPETRVDDLIKLFSKMHIDFFNKNYYTTYIPVLRSLRQINNSSAYKDRTKNDYFKDILELYDKEKDKIEEIDIFTGEQLYSEVRKLLLSDYEQRQIIIEFEELLSQYFFYGNKVSLIPRESDDKSNDQDRDLYIKIGNEKEYPIYNLGDGIQTIIIYTFPLFKYKHKKHFLFIEEPEQNLHPGMQRILLEILNDDRLKNATVFFTTHSNHLLDSTIDSSDKTSIFSFQKEEIDANNGNTQTANFIVENLKSPNINVLDNLGIRNSSVFLSNCTIWVEGVTDRKYIKQFMKIYCKKNNITNYQEDIHYSFVEYAGSNIAHWGFEDEKKEGKDKIFAKSISNRIFFIADSDVKLVKSNDVKVKDNPKKYFEVEGKIFEIKKYKRHAKLKEELGEKGFYRLDSKEIENILTPLVIKNVIAKYENKEVGKLIFKNDFSKEEEGGKPIYWWQNLGKFIEDNVEGLTKNYSKKNTIKDKVGFCNKAVEYMATELHKENWIENYKNLLSDEAEHLCEKIINFIEKK